MYEQVSVRRYENWHSYSSVSKTKSCDSRTTTILICLPRDTRHEDKVVAMRIVNYEMFGNHSNQMKVYNTPDVLCTWKGETFQACGIRNRSQVVAFECPLVLIYTRVWPKSDRTQSRKKELIFTVHLNPCCDMQNLHHFWYKQKFQVSIDLETFL